MELSRGVCVTDVQVPAVLIPTCRLSIADFQGDVVLVLGIEHPFPPTLRSPGAHRT
jgi:hypothetical protein